MPARRRFRETDEQLRERSVRGDLRDRPQQDGAEQPGSASGQFEASKGL